MGQAIDHLDAAESKIKTSAAPEYLEANKGTASFDAAHIWMDLAAGSGKNVAESKADKARTIPSLPDLDLHSSKEDDHGGKSTVAEGLIDDINTVLHHSTAGGANIRTEQQAQLSKEKSDGDLPVVKCNDITPGQIGVLMSKNADGHTYYTPFVAAAPDVNPRGGDESNSIPISLNENAAKELHIDSALKHGGKANVDVITLPGDAFLPPMPRSTGELNEVVLSRIHGLAETIRDDEAAERAKAEAALPAPPPPDAEFGYRRTDRGADELRKVADNFRTSAREFQKAAAPEGIEDRRKAFAKQAQADMTKYQKEIDQHKLEFNASQKDHEQLTKQATKVGTKDSDAAKQIQEKIQAADERAKKFDAALQTSQYNLSYAQSELNISKDTSAFTRHMQAKASAAAIMSFNPDMDAALAGHRIVVNSGHYPGDPKFPGFSFDGTDEWKLNLESEDVAGAMIKMAGGAVKLVNQIDLKPKDRGQTGLAAAIKAAKPEAAIAIHHDDDDPRDSPFMRGTLTLQCAKTSGAASLDFAKAVHSAKLNYVGLDDRVNAKGDSVGIREQCGRGIQGHNIGAPFILDEQLSTHKDEWPLALNPKVNAEIQFAHVTSLYEYFNNKPRYRASAEEAKLWKDQIWSKTNMDDIWTNRPKVGAWKS